MSRAVCLLVFLSGLFAAAPSPAAEPEGDAAVENLEDLRATLKDEERRKEFLRNLDALIAARRGAGESKAPAAAEEEKRGPVGEALALLNGLTDRVRGTLTEVVREASSIPNRFRSFGSRLKNREYRARVVEGVLYLIGLGILAVFVLWLMRRLLRWPRSRFKVAEGEEKWGLWARVWRLVVIALLEVLPALVLLAVGYAALSLVGPPSPADRLLMILLWAVVVRRIVRVVVEVVFAPRWPRIRLVPAGDEKAVAVSRSLGRIASVGVYGFFAIQAAATLGADEGLLRAAQGAYGLVLLVLGVVFVLRQRGPVRNWLLERRRAAKEEKDAAPSLLSTFLASVVGLWWALALLYMFALYMTWASGLEGGFAFLLRASGVTAIAVVAAVLISSLVSAFLRRIQRATEGLVAGYPQLRSRVGSYVTAVRIALVAAIAVLATCFALEAWGIDALSALSSPLAVAIFGTIAQLLLIYLLAAAAIDVATVFTQRYLMTREESGLATAKVRTLVPLVRSVVKIVVVVIAGIMALSEIGVDIGPILAGVGMLGLAVGFGAQTLVKDIITGFFILVEDAVSVGDVAVLGGQGGVVERVSLRTVRLRDLSGNVHVIPYSSVGTVTNMTKEFSYYLVEAGVAYREDTDEVVAVLQEVLEEMRGEDAWKRDILEPLEVLGVDRFEDSAVIVRVRIKTKPIRQWAVGREFNRRMKKAFDARGIEIPFPHRTIWMGEPKEGPPPPLHLRVSERLEARPEALPEASAASSGEE